MTEYPQNFDDLYGYTKLNKDSKEIRLLYIHPRKWYPRVLAKDRAWNPPVECSLAVASLDDEPVYETLSYVWGDSNDRVAIRVNGRRFWITRNLHSALEKLVPEDEIRTMWIDAICIDQSDAGLAERAEQVRLMGKIFAGAFCVTAYLGDPYDGLEAAMEFIEMAAANPSMHLDHRKTTCLSIPSTDTNDSWNDLYRYIHTFFDRPWWDRTWTVQEFILARDVYFQLGKYRYPWSTMASGVKNIRYHGYHCCRTAKVYFFQSQNDIQQRAWEFCTKLHILKIYYYKSRRVHRPPSADDILDAVAEYRMREASDSRDKIYGLLGLADHDQTLVELDYTIPVEQVYEKFTLSVIKEMRNLKILSNLGGARRCLSGLASFVPDWTILPGTGRHASSRMRRMTGRNKYQARLYDACAGTEPLWKPISPGRVHVNGFVFDTIIQTIKRHDYNPDAKAWWVSHYAWLQRIVQATSNTTGLVDAGSRKRRTADHEALVRTLCSDSIYSRSKYERVNWDTDGKSLRRWWAWIYQPEEDQVTYTDAGTSNVDAAAIMSRSGRVFIITEMGYIGLAVDECQEGDLVAILGGGLVPLILRPVPAGNGTAGDGDGVSSETAYQVIGDSYIHGIMDGHAFEILGRLDREFDGLVLI